MPTGRPPGWYPDPWGTDHERWFDGAAWTPRTRTPGGTDAPVPDGPPAGEAGAEAGAPGPAPPPEAPPAVPPGWYPDPWGLAARRWWDGRAWTGHVDPPAPGTEGAPRHLDDEQFHARLARAALGLAGPAAAVGVVSLAAQIRWIVDHRVALADPARRDRLVEEFGGGLVVLAGQVVLAGLMVAALLFLLWVHRAAAAASRVGLPAVPSPGRAVAAFLVPVANLWLGWRVTRSLVPAASTARRLAVRWWLSVLGFVAATAGMVVGAFVDHLAMSVLAGVAVTLALAAAGVGRALVTEVTRVHAVLGDGGSA